MRRWAWGLLLACGACGGSAPTPAPRIVTPGVRDVLKDQILPGSELTVVPREDRSAPLVVRITESQPHGTDWRYQLEWYGLDPGTYDLRDYLQRVDGSSMDGVPSIPVEVLAVLPPGQVMPHDLEPGALPSYGGYRGWLWFGGICWTLGLLAFVFWRRRVEISAESDSKPLTFADRLRPLVERAVTGSLPTGEQAQLERMLVAFWRVQLNLRDTDMATSLRTLRDHPEAGGLLRALETWLHAPPERRDAADIPRLLAPYRSLPGDAYERLAAGETSA